MSHGHRHQQGGCRSTGQIAFDTAQRMSLWDKNFQMNAKYELKGHEAPVYSVAWDGQSELFATGSNALKLWDLRDNCKLVKTFRGHEGKVYSIVFSPRGQPPRQPQPPQRPPFPTTCAVGLWQATFWQAAAQTSPSRCAHVPPALPPSRLSLPSRPSAFPPPASPLSAFAVVRCARACGHLRCAWRRCGTTVGT